MQGFLPKKLKYLLYMLNSQLPDFLGGDCRCPEEGGCLFAEKGPWKDPVIMKVNRFDVAFKSLCKRTAFILDTFDGAGSFRWGNQAQTNRYYI